MSTIIYENRHYVACAMNDGSLIVQRKAKRRGVRVLPGTDSDMWIEQIRTAENSAEAATLCRAFLTEYEV